jgi:hypothetical protein
MEGLPARQHRCPGCHADVILIDGDPPAPRFAVFACGSRESRIAGSYRFSETAECVALAEERSELDVPESSGW